MRKYIAVFLMLVMMVGLTACSQSDLLDREGEDMGVILTTRVVEICGSSLLLASMEEDARIGDIYQINAKEVEVFCDSGSKLDISALKNGMVIEVTYNGLVQESFPMGLGGVKSIKIIKQGEDIIGLYKKVIEDLYTVDPGLNNEISILAFDLTKVLNLSGTEKRALLYLLENTYGMDTMMATYRELIDLGYIDEERLYFEKGLLFSIEDTAISNDQFSFNAKKWRSGLGAYIFYDCTGKKSKTGWDYTIGAHMIS